MRVVLLTFGFLLLLTVRADASCIAAIKWEGDWYQGHRVKVTLGEKLAAQAVVPACNDAGQNDPDTKTAVYRVSGVDPHVGVVTRGMIWWNAHTFPWLAEHPLYKRLGFDKLRTSPRKGKPCTVTAKVNETFGSFSLDHKPQRFVSLRRDTKITLRRHGVAWIEAGTRIRIRGGCGRDTVYADRIDKA